MFVGALLAFNGKYVCSKNWGKEALQACVPHIQNWEIFDFIPLPNGKISIRSHANGLFVSADPYGPKPLVANKMTAGVWEMF